MEQTIDLNNIQKNDVQIMEKSAELQAYLEEDNTSEELKPEKAKAFVLDVDVVDIENADETYVQCSRGYDEDGSINEIDEYRINLQHVPTHSYVEKVVVLDVALHTGSISKVYCPVHKDDTSHLDDLLNITESDEAWQVKGDVIPVKKFNDKNDLYEISSGYEEFNIYNHILFLFIMVIGLSVVYHMFTFSIAVIILIISAIYIPFSLTQYYIDKKWSKIDDDNLFEVLQFKYGN